MGVGAPCQKGENRCFSQPLSPSLNGKHNWKKTSLVCHNELSFWTCYFRTKIILQNSFDTRNWIYYENFVRILFARRQFSQWPIIMLGLLSPRNHPILLTDQGGYITLLTSSRRRILRFLRSRSNLARHVITRGVLWWIGSASFVIGSSDNGVIPSKNLRQFLSELCWNNESYFLLVCGTQDQIHSLPPFLFPFFLRHRSDYPNAKLQICLQSVQPGTECKTVLRVYNSGERELTQKPFQSRATTSQNGRHFLLNTPNLLYNKVVAVKLRCQPSEWLHLQLQTSENKIIFKKFLNLQLYYLLIIPV